MTTIRFPNVAAVRKSFPDAISQKEWLIRESAKEHVSERVIYRRLRAGKYRVLRLKVNPRVIYYL